MLKVGQIEQVEITGYSSEGMGICRIEGCAVFVPNAIRGEVCTVKLTHVSRNSAHGKIEGIVVRSPHRVRRACPEAKLCGGCQLHHMDYAEELNFKAQKVADALTRIGGQSLPFANQPAGNGQQASGQGIGNREPGIGDGGRGSFDFGCASAQDDPAGAVIGRPAEAPATVRAVTGRPAEVPATVGAVIGRPAEVLATVGAVTGRPQSLPEATGNGQQASGQGIGNREPGIGEGGCGSFDFGCASAQDDPAGAVIGRPQSLPLANQATGNRQQKTEKAFPLGGRWPAGPDEGTSDDHTVPITGAAEISSYRNKAQYPLAMKNGKPVAGFYKNRSHEVIPVKRCAILPAVFDQVKDVVLRWAEEDRVSVYDEGTGKGLLRHIYVRKGAVSGQVMVCVVANGQQLPRENRLIHALRREIPGLASVVLSVNTKNTNVVLGSEFRTLWGRDEIEDELCGFRFRLSPRSFYQVNHDQAQRLYEKAVELADLHGTETVLDLYCGTGTITLALSRKAGKAVGVELVPEAVEDAKENAARNGVTNVEFFCADAKIAAERLCAEGAAPDVILVDPPRKGLSPEVIDAMVQMAPGRIVYVSCDPATLARDVKLLSQYGYALTHAEAFDLFPRTFHVETVVLMTRK